MKPIKLTKEEKKKHTPIKKAIKEVIKEKKVASKKEKVIIKEDKVELVQYTIKAVIPTGAYANIQPEITVNASSLEKAEAYVIPHINKLFVDFLNKSERREVVPTVTVKETPAPKTADSVEEARQRVFDKLEKMENNTPLVNEENKSSLDPQKTNEEIARLNKEKTQKTEPEPLHSNPYIKAKAAVDSCMSIEALEVIKAQVVRSTKLTENEKNALLMVVIVAKEKTLEL